MIKIRSPSKKQTIRIDAVLINKIDQYRLINETYSQFIYRLLEVAHDYLSHVAPELLKKNQKTENLNKEKLEVFQTFLERADHESTIN